MIWNRDRTKSKELANSELSFIYFLCDPRSEYFDIIDEESKIKNIKEGIGLKDKWKPDEAVLEGIKLYKQFLEEFDICVQLLASTQIAVDKVSTFLRQVDLNKEDDKGKPVYTINSITSAIKQIPGLSKDIMEARKTLNKDLEEATRMKGNKTRKLFEDGINI